MNTSLPTVAAEKRPARGPAKAPKGSAPQKRHGDLILLAIFLTLVLVCAVLGGSILSTGSSVLAKTFASACDSEKKTTYDNFYSDGFNAGAEKYQSEHKIMLSVSGVRETKTLEVLNVSDAVFAAKTVEDTLVHKVQVWYRYTGAGTYNVDLQNAEFVVDSECRYVLARIPHPVLANVKITDSEQLFANEDFELLGKLSDGTDIEFEMRNEAKAEIEEKLKSEYMRSRAESAAKTAVETLIRKFNTGVEDLTVDVEFLD